MYKRALELYQKDAIQVRVVIEVTCSIEKPFMGPLDCKLIKTRDS